MRVVTKRRGIFYVASIAEETADELVPNYEWPETSVDKFLTDVEALWSKWNALQPTASDSERKRRAKLAKSAKLLAAPGSPRMLAELQPAVRVLRIELDKHKHTSDAVRRAHGWRLAQLAMDVGRLARDLEANEALFGALDAKERSRLARLEMGKKSNALRKEEADKEILDKFAKWQQKKAAVLVMEGGPVTVAERVNLFLKTRQVRSPRQKRRLKSLLKQGRIPLPVK